MSARIMAHMVAHYPDPLTALDVGRALFDAGVSYIEVQFPFSDPTADGPTIQDACTHALAAGFTVEDGFRLIEALSSYREQQNLQTPIMIMSYASLVFARTIPRFCARARAAGAAGLIVPDLPLDSDEGLYAIGESNGLEVVPVVVPSMTEKRRALLFQRRPNYVYAALRSGITGSYTDIGAENLAFLESLRPLDARILAGFGIREPSQVRTLMLHVHAAVVGSAIVTTVASAERSAVHSAVVKRVSELVRA